MKQRVLAFFDADRIVNTKMCKATLPSLCKAAKPTEKIIFLY